MCLHDTLRSLNLCFRSRVYKRDYYYSVAKTTRVPRGPDPEVTPAAILRFMVEHPDPGFTAVEVAEEFDKSRQWADNRLKVMVDDGLLHSKNPGGRARWYWPSSAGKELLRESRD
jgi:predicted HTH transcriptional regulator